MFIRKLLFLTIFCFITLLNMLVHADTPDNNEINKKISQSHSQEMQSPSVVSHVFGEHSVLNMLGEAFKVYLYKNKVHYEVATGPGIYSFSTWQGNDKSIATPVLFYRKNGKYFLKSNGYGEIQLDFEQALIHKTGELMGKRVGTNEKVIFPFSIIVSKEDRKMWRENRTEVLKSISDTNAGWGIMDLVNNVLGPAELFIAATFQMKFEQFISRQFFYKKVKEKGSAVEYIHIKLEGSDEYQKVTFYPIFNPEKRYENQVLVDSIVQIGDKILRIQWHEKWPEKNAEGNYVIPATSPFNPNAKYVIEEEYGGEEGVRKALTIRMIQSPTEPELGGGTQQQELSTTPKKQPKQPPAEQNNTIQPEITPDKPKEEKKPEKTKLEAPNPKDKDKTPEKKEDTNNQSPQDNKEDSNKEDPNKKAPNKETKIEGAGEPNPISAFFSALWRAIVYVFTLGFLF